MSEPGDTTGIKVFGDLPGSPKATTAMSAKELGRANLPRLRVLLSFHYYGKEDLDTFIPRYFTPPYPEIFIDSGAYSAASQGARIDLQEYASYLKRYAHWISTYANLDAIGDAAGTLANQRRLEDLGLHPLPVFHVAEPWRALERYLDEYPYIALGGMVPWARLPKRLWPWLVRCFQLARRPDKSWRAVYHGFGVTSWQFLSALPWYSVDSSSWGAGFRYGQVPVFDAAAGKFLDVQLGDHTSCYRHARALRALGFDPADFSQRSRNDRSKICAVAALSYLAAERWLRRRHGEITIPGRPGDPGLRLHLVDGSVDNLHRADEGVKVYLCGDNNHARYRQITDGLAERATQHERLPV